MVKLNRILDYQVLRFGIVGLVSNGILFVAYLALTEFGVGSNTAMTALYATGVLQGFIFNKKWTFSHDSQTLKTFTAYVFLYAIGYLINLVILFLLVEKLGFRHQWVQGGAILLLAGFFFLAQNFFIFKTDNHNQSRTL